jgi:hypothetical protein
MISGFRRHVDENCALLGCYAASSCNFVPTFRKNLLVLSSGVKNNPEERICHCITLFRALLLELIFISDGMQTYCFIIRYYKENH